MPLRSSTSPVLPRTAKGVSLGALTASLRDGKVKPSGPVIAEAFDALAGKLNTVIESLRNSSPALQDFWVTDANGKPITWIGSRPPYSGLWSAEFYNGGTDPSNAPLFAANDGEVVIGQNGYVHVRDPYGADAAWLGTQYDTLPVTGAANNGANLVRLTVVGHTYQTGDEAIVAAVGGCEQYTTGAWTVTRIDADHIDLQNSLFGGTYTSGGTVTRLMHVTGAANNGSGLIRLTVTAHGYESGDMVNVASVGGVPNATGQWVISVITANTFDLVGSTFAGAYTSGGICLRYFGGMLAQTFAIGDSFADYKLRAKADGSLSIKDSLISLTGSDATVTLDPTTGAITVESAAAHRKITLNDAGIEIVSTSVGSTLTSEFTESSIVSGQDGGKFDFEEALGLGVSQTAAALSGCAPLWLEGYLNAVTTVGAVVRQRTVAGTYAAPGNVSTGDAIGGFLAKGEPAADYVAAVLALANENFTAGDQGTAITIEVTPNGSTVRAEVARFTSTGVAVTGDLDITGAYKSGGAAGLTSNRTVVYSVIPTTTTLQYLNWASAPVSATVVNGVATSTTTHGFTGGILTA